MCGGLAIDLSISFTIHAGEIRFHSYRTPKYLRLLTKNRGSENGRRILPFLIKLYSCLRRICNRVGHYGNKWGIKQSLDIYIQLYA